MRHVPRRHTALHAAGVAVAPYPTLRQILFLLLVAFALSQFLVFPAFGEQSTHAGLLAAELFLLWMAALALRRGKWVAEDVFLLNAVASRALWITLLAATGASVVVSAFDMVVAAGFEMVPWSQPLYASQMLVRIQLIDSVYSALLVLLTVVVVTAVCEEALFRGLIFTGLRYHYGPGAAILGSALLFAAVHLNPWQFPALFLLGLFLAALVHWTHSLYPAILGHAVNNGLSVLAVNSRAHTGIDILGAIDPVPVPVLVVAGCALIVGIRWLRRIPPVMPILSPFSRPAPADGLPTV